MQDSAAMPTPGEPPLLRTQDLTRRVGPKILVEGISVEVRTAEVLAVTCLMIFRRPSRTPTISKRWPFR